MPLDCPHGSVDTMIFDRILVGIDGSDYSFEALHQALALRSPDATVLALTVLEEGLAAHAGFQATQAADSLSEMAAEASGKAAALLQDVPGEARIVRGHYALDTLLTHARTDRSSLIAVGGRHHSRATGIALGGVFAGVLHDAPCSVLVARPQWGERWEPHRVLVGLDGSAPALAARAAAEDLAARLGSSVEVLAATGGKLIDADGEWTAAARIDTWSPEHPVAALVDRSATLDLIVVGSRGLHGVRALGSVSERVAYQAHCSVLVVRPRSTEDVSAA